MPINPCCEGPRYGEERIGIPTFVYTYSVNVLKLFNSADPYRTNRLLRLTMQTKIHQQT